MIHDNAVRQVDNETIVVFPRSRTLFVGLLICFVHYFIGFVMRIAVEILVEK